MTMKKNYILPNIKVVEVEMHNTLLAGSNEDVNFDSTPINGGDARSKGFGGIFDDDDL